MNSINTTVAGVLVLLVLFVLWMVLVVLFVVMSVLCVCVCSARCLACGRFGALVVCGLCFVFVMCVVRFEAFGL